MFYLLLHATGAAEMKRLWLATVTLQGLVCLEDSKQRLAMPVLHKRNCLNCC